MNLVQGERAGATEPSLQSSTRARVRVWDVPTRLFHWLLVALIAVSIYTGWTGGLREMEFHQLSGYAILTLVLFRLIWGFVGHGHARFADFVRGPRTVLAYLHGLIRAPYRPHLGHNPLGGWSVLAMLASLLVQATTGLFASDDIFTEGPLHDKVASGTAGTLSTIHEVNSNVLIGLVAIHVIAVFAYLIVKRDNLIVPMVTGRKAWVEPIEGGTGARKGVRAARGELWAIVVLACSAAVVWQIVTL